MQPMQIIEKAFCILLIQYVHFFVFISEYLILLIKPN